MRKPAKAPEISTSWTPSTLKDLGKWSGGGTPRKDDPRYWEGGVLPWVSPKDMKRERILDSQDYITDQALSESAATLVPAGSVLVVTRSGILRHTLPVAVTGVPVAINQDLKALTPKAGILPEYVAWALRAFGQDIIKTCSKHGTTVQSVEMSSLLRFEIPVVPLAQQARIVAQIEKQFSRLDEAVANLKRVKTNLKRYKAAVLKAAVEGKLTEQWRKDHPDVEPASTLLERILIERKAKWEQIQLAKVKAGQEDSEPNRWKGKYKKPAEPDTEDLPQIPKGWRWCTADQLFSYVTSGSRGWARYYSNAGPIFLRVGNLDHDSVALDLSEVQRVQPPMATEGSRTRVEMDDVLISITADVGMVAVVPHGFAEAYINQHIALARPVGLARVQYVAWYLASRLGQKQFQNLQRGATKAGLGLDDIRSVSIPLPPLEEQGEIVSQIAARLSTVAEVDKEITANVRRANLLRQSILRHAFTGRLLQERRDSELLAVAKQ
jgi:type I restriction enzyme, S subunit